MDYFNTLPLEITADILTRLPTESVLDSKLVCTTWRNLVSHHPSFNKMHLDHLNLHESGKLGLVAGTLKENCYSFENICYIEYNENDESIERIRRVVLSPLFRESVCVGSCNGLICLSKFRTLTLEICICNLITKEYVMLPHIKIDSDPGPHRYICWTRGFGYVSTTNEYKVVGICVLNDNAEVYIYTLGSGDGWRSLGTFDFRLNLSSHWGQGTFANESLYWLNVGSNMIITLDLAEEKFCEHLSLPPPEGEFIWIYNGLRVLDGCLYLTVTPHTEEIAVSDIWLLISDIWLLKKKNDNHDMKEQEEHLSWVWSREFKFDKRGLVAATKGDGVIAYKGNCLYIDHPKASSSKKLMEFEEELRAVFLHKNTLVSLKELGEENTKIMESVEIEEVENHE